MKFDSMLTTDNRDSSIAEDYFAEIQALRARLKQVEAENRQLRELIEAIAEGRRSREHANV